MPSFIDALGNLKVLVNTVFGTALDTYKPFSDKFAGTATSNTAANVYPFSDAIPDMKEVVGPKEFNALKNFLVTVVNKRFDGSLMVRYDDIADDNVGLVPDQIAELAKRGARLKDQQVSLKLEAGLTETGYDGATFFSTTHALSGTNQSNRLSGALDATNLAAALAALRSFKNSEGQPFDAGQGTPILMVPPGLEFTARALVLSTVTTGGENVLAGAAEVVVNPYLTDATRWYLLNGSSAIKPVMWQEREAPHLKDWDEPKIFSHGFSVEARGAAFLTLWHLALTSK